MPEIGQTLAHYKILEKIGAGGMGEVYKAADTRLGREVAIKVLPEAFSQNRERLARFEREARLLASMNHPNIATIHGLERADGSHFLVLEFVPGETLDRRISRGPIPVAEALNLFKQVAAAMDAAHEKGIIHRDLKPANIKLTPENTVKILDFGIAKALAGDSSGPEVSESPTIRSDTTIPDTTEPGIILGTAPYMSPEQARGMPVDKRADIWAFGCCLYEALSGRKAFEGETTADIFAAILNTEPIWKSLPTATPPLIRELIQRCLRKETKLRLRDIGDGWIEIQESLKAPFPERLAEPKARTVSWSMAACISVVLASLAGLAVWLVRIPALHEPPRVARFDITLPQGGQFDLSVGAFAFSPDGTMLAFAALNEGVRRLYLRALDAQEAQPISGTEGAEAPFFSPNGEWLGFFAEGKLKKVLLAGGAPINLCEGQLSRGASWAPDDTIFFTQRYGSPISRISADGKILQEITRLETTRGECEHSYPEILPGGKSMLFTAWTGVSFDDPHVAVQSITAEANEPKHRILIEGASNARYAFTGHIIYVRAETLYAAPFDINRLEVTGAPIPLMEGVVRSQFDFSRNGALAYIHAGAQEQSTLVWVDRKGGMEEVSKTRRSFMMPRISPDGTRMALNIFDGNKHDVWIYVFAQDTFSRLTFENGNAYALWTPNGQHLTFSSDRDGPVNVFWKAADGSGPAKRLVKSDTIYLPSSWSLDGHYLAVTEIHPKTAGNIWLLSMDDGRPPIPFLNTPFDEYEAVFSPDGRWLAYVSNESGRDEVYVSPHPGPGGKVQISSGGGMGPLWAPGGRELFYLTGDSMISVALETEPVLKVGDSKALFKPDFKRFPLAGFRNHDMTPDGRRFVAIKGGQEKASSRIHIVLNWFEELKRFCPAN